LEKEIEALHTDLVDFKRFVCSKLEIDEQKSKKKDKRSNQHTKMKPLPRLGSVRFINNGPEMEDESDTASSSSDDEDRPRQPPPQHQKTIIFSTSITRDIDNVRFNECYQNGHARFQKWHGGRAKHMKHYVTTHMLEEKPDTVVIQAGGNDLRTMRNNPTPALQVAHDIIDIGLACKKKGASRVCISGVPIRKAKFLQERARDVNEVLVSQCRLYNFTYIDNADITLEYLHNDGVHLNHEGTKILANNYLDCLNSL
jgi:hypothetical protein